MNRKINSKLAIAIVFVAAIAAGAVCLSYAREKGIKVQEFKSISIKATASDKKNYAGKPMEWKLISGSANDICSIPVYEGRTQVRGWYVYDYGYDKKKAWMLRIADEDKIKLPIFEQNQNRKDFHLKVRLEQATPELEKDLKKASPEKPIIVEIKRYLAFCDGVSIASIKSAENI